MKKILKKKFEHFLLKKKRMMLQRVTDEGKVLKLIESLYPIQTQFELIRLGPSGDGGYLVPNDLEGIEACFSPGVDKISEFELDCLEHGMKIYMADKSVEKPNLNVSEDKYSFIKKFVGCTNNDDYITMDNWVKSNYPEEETELILQMDIEGGEYNSLINMSDSLINSFRIMIIEFHSLQNLWNPHHFNLSQAVFNKILQTHTCVHIHPNNYCGIDSRLNIEIPPIAEFTFIRKDRIKTKKFASNFPHKLDYDNTKKESIHLPQNWYKAT
jgi:hypothetical protein